MSAGTRFAAANTEAAATGLRLCGMVDEPPRPFAVGSNNSAISVCIMSDQSRAILPVFPTIMPSTLAISTIRSRSPCHVLVGTVRFSC
ncbi:hypothetical protein D3C74_452920 [compost metagenome]